MANDEIKTLTALLNFVNDNPDKVVLEPREYANVLTYAFSDKFYPLDPIIFPEMRLHVVRLTSAEIAANKDLLNYFYSRTSERKPVGFKTVWITTSHITKSGLALFELSFE